MALERRPLSNSASTASWSMRFSLRRMTSGALCSISFFSRLLRLMTRRYRSFRSRGEAAAVERHQRAQVRRDHRDHVQDHPLRLVCVARVAGAERVDDLEPLEHLFLRCWTGLDGHLRAQLSASLSTSIWLQQLAHRVGAPMSARKAVSPSSLRLVAQREVLVLVEQLRCFDVLARPGR
jgi:hypothetical protein